MERMELRLEAELARFLSERARRLHSTPDALISSMLARWVRFAHETEELGSDETVQERMALIAEHYVEESRELLENDPDLCLDVGDPQRAASGTSQEQALPRGADDAEPPVAMSNAEIERAFAEIAEHYEELSREVFGDEPALSAGALPERHMVAVYFAIPETSRGTSWRSALMERIERVISGRPGDHPAEMRQGEVYLRLPAGERIDVPTIFYVEPDPARLPLSAAADR